MTHVSLTRIGPNAIVEQVKAVYIQPNFEYNAGCCDVRNRFQDMMPKSCHKFSYVITRFSVTRVHTWTQVWRDSSIDCVVRLY